MADKYNNSRTKFRNSRIEAGLCRDCGVVPFEKNWVVCEPCHIRRSENGKRHGRKKLAIGICRRCGNWNDQKGKYHCSKCIQIQIEQFRQRRKYNKEFIVNYFGGKCLECGEKDIRCLSLDHIDNDGRLDKKSEKGKRQVTPTWYAKLVKLIKSNKPLPRRLQLLCFNCHAKKDLNLWWYNDDNNPGNFSEKWK